MLDMLLDPSQPSQHPGSAMYLPGRCKSDAHISQLWSRGLNLEGDDRLENKSKDGGKPANGKMHFSCLR